MSAKMSAKIVQTVASPIGTTGSAIPKLVKI